MTYSNDNSEVDKDLRPEEIVLRKGESVVGALRQLSGHLHRLSELYRDNVKMKEAQNVPREVD